jgi:thymidylate synthase
MGKLNLIIALDKYFGFSKDNNIPWFYKEDLKHFKNTTNNNCILMGRNTFLTLKEPLKNRINIVISSTLHDYIIKPEFATYLFIFDTLDKGIHFAKSYKEKDIYICGGLNIYNTCLNNYILDEIYLTYINKDYNCDLFININNLYNYKKIETIYKNDTNDELRILKLRYSLKTYKFPLKIFNNEFAYLNNLNLILKNGKETLTRNGYTLSLFAPPEMRFNLLDGFPLLTTKKMFWRGIVLELIMFINGITDSKYLANQGVKIWEPNTTREFLDSKNLNYEIGDMGPMYGWNWRHFGADYINKDTDYTNKGFDQLAHLIHLIKTDPTSRRLLLTSLDPSKVAESVLPPCHSLPIQFYISDSYIDCKMTQRSADMFLGVPFNIASTSLLLHLIANLTGYTARYVVLSLGDAHIYKDHIDKCNLQLTRCPMDLCNVNCIKKLETLKDLETLTFDDIELINYKSHSAINAKMIA